MTRETLPWSPLGVLGSGNVSSGTARLPSFPEDLATAAAAELEPELMFLAWEAARFAWEQDPARLRPSLLLALAVLAVQGEGSTRLPLTSGLLDPILTRLGAREEDLSAVAALVRELQSHQGSPADGLFGGPGDYRPLVIDGPWLYTQRLLLLEERLARGFAALLATERAAAVGAALTDIASRPAFTPGGQPLRLSGEQEAAVAASLSGRLTVVTGGPGTGKTSIVVSLLRAVARLGNPSLERIALAAPTGKAAHRLQSSVRDALERVDDPAPADLDLLGRIPAASTLHRLLSYSPAGERFRRHPGNPLEEELVVVDESSMLDLALADRLLGALPAEARLVLLGDARQLPSVEAGAVFRDLVTAASAAAPGRVGRLTHSYRMDAEEPAGRAILALAAAALEGRELADDDGGRPSEGRGELLPRRRQAAELTFVGPELLLAASPGDRVAFLERWLEERVAGLAGWEELARRVFTLAEESFPDAERAAVDSLLAHYDRLRILCATRGYDSGAGAAAVNDWFRARLLERWAARTGPETGPDGSSAAAEGLLPGEPVLVTSNDYRRGLFNGDQGVVLAVAGDDGSPARPCAVFRRQGELAPVPLAALQGRLAPAWATTVHKAQGIEVDFAALLLPARAVRGLTRELVYTALTRARRSVVVLGSSERLREALQRRDSRHSGLAERIAAACPEGGKLLS